LKKKQIFSNISNKIKQFKLRRLILKVSYTAAVILIGFISIFIVREYNHTEKQKNQISSNMIVGQSLPEEEAYILSDGIKFKLKDKSHVGLINNGTAIITNSDNSTKMLALSTVAMNRLVVPYGKRANLTLSDGTVIWLNSGTQLDFPSEFVDNTREIFVNGEVFIEVKKDLNMPFIVHAGDINVTVTGTSFNLSAYLDDNMKSVVLVNGKVQVETKNNYKTDLLPNEKIEINNNSIKKEIVEISEYISWKDGLLELYSTPMSEILKKIGRYYNVQFEKSELITLNNETFTGKLFLSNSLDSVMTSISTLSSTEFLRDGNNIYIIKKEMPMK
jgi:transmembrane sensor